MNYKSITVLPEQLQRFGQLIQAQTGSKITATQWSTLERTLQQRLQATRLSIGHYLTLLRVESRQMARVSQDSRRSPQPVTEWEHLMPLITTGESFFFRDQGQFHVLKTKLLPDLILQQLQRQRVQGLSRPSLRVWSAGCSSGEEAYSLAILLTELLPNWRDWDLKVLGTDINPLAIAKAKQGLYRAWSFRQVEEQVITRYFQKQAKGWQIRDYIKEITQFQISNLVQDSYANGVLGVCPVDLIVCRNVFIYCNPGAIATIVEKFHASLKPGGYLLTGHTELQGIGLENWTIRSFPESLVYQPATPIR